MRSVEITPRGILGTVAVLVVVAVCVRLGFWQLDRHRERSALNDQITERLDERVALSAAPREGDTAGLPYSRTTLVGEIDDDRAIVLAGRSYSGAPGVHLLSPLRMADGAVLVNRGWVPAPDGATAEIDPLRLEGRVRVEGVLRPFPDVQTGADLSSGFVTRWFRFDGDAIRSQFPYRVAPLYLQAIDRPTPVGDSAAAAEDAAESPGAAEPGAPQPGAAAEEAEATRAPPGSAQGLTVPVPLGAPGPESGPHLSYAIQWFSFAAIFLVGWAVLVARRDPGPGAPVAEGEAEPG